MYLQKVFCNRKHDKKTYINGKYFMRKMSVLVKTFVNEIKWCVKRLKDLTVNKVLKIFSIILHKSYTNLMNAILMIMIIELS